MCSKICKERDATLLAGGRFHPSLLTQPKKKRKLFSFSSWDQSFFRVVFLPSRARHNVLNIFNHKKTKFTSKQKRILMLVSVCVDKVYFPQITEIFLGEEKMPFALFLFFLPHMLIFLWQKKNNCHLLWFVKSLE